MKIAIIFVLTVTIYNAYGLQCEECFNKECEDKTCKEDNSDFCLTVTVPKGDVQSVSKGCATSAVADDICKRAETDGGSCERCAEDLCNKDKK